VYLERFSKCCKTSDETYVAFASKLKGMLDYYLQSRDVKDFAKLCELLICDRIKSVLSEGCLRYVLSIESASKPGWMTMRELTEAIDRYTAAHSAGDKPHAFAVGQTPLKSYDSAAVLPHTLSETPAAASSTVGRGRGGGVINDNRRCHHCGEFGHIRPMCPERRSSSTGTAPAGGVKRVSVEAGPTRSISEQVTGEVQAVVLVGLHQNEDQTGVNFSAPTDASGADGRESVVVASCDNVNVSSKVVNNTASVSACSHVTNVVSKLSALKYVDISVTCDNTDVVNNVFALCDSGADICCVKSTLITDLTPNIVGKIQLRAFCGPPVEAGLVCLTMSFGDCDKSNAARSVYV